jgi:uncharacterized protein with PIN domain
MAQDKPDKPDKDRRKWKMKCEYCGHPAQYLARYSMHPVGRPEQKTYRTLYQCPKCQKITGVNE